MDRKITIFFIYLSFAIVAHAEEKVQGLRVSFDVETERFEALVCSPEATQYVLAFAKGDAAIKTLQAEVEKTQGVNKGWSWSLSPKSIRFTDSVPPQCQDTPSIIERTARRTFCSRRSRIVRVQDCRSGECLNVRGLYAGRSPAF